SSGIKWHYDPRNGHEFSRDEFYSQVKITNPDGGWDIKYPWELSRLQHFPRLAFAWKLTGDRKYLDALVSQARDWIRENPVGFGPNWACTMDCAIRAANLAYSFAVAGKEIGGDFASEIACSLIAHGKFIASHLEWSNELTSNHYLADIAGLAVLGCLMEPAVEIAGVWRKFACDELSREIEKQVYPDGWDFEASTAYHRLAMECFLIPAILMERNGEPMGERYRDRLRLMTEFVRDITLPDGSFPLIGDNDSGLFMSLHPRENNDLNYILALSSAYLCEPSLKLDTVPMCPEVMWMMGDVGRGRFEAFEACDRPSIASYPDGGLYCVRSDDGMDFLIFRLGKVGQSGNGGHAHNDQLSVTIWFEGKPLIVDPGSACYTSDPMKRNLYRSTKSHATIALGDCEQNRFVEGNLFTLRQEAFAGDVKIETDDGTVSLSGTMSGYGCFSEDEVKIRRSIVFTMLKRQFEITDELNLSGNASGETARWHFPLAPGLSVVECGPGRLAINSESGEHIADLLYLPGWEFDLDDTVYSPSYGEEIPNMTLQFTPPSQVVEAKFVIKAVEWR
ncbi:MAG TPA: alginate lyase family protein, partial [Firmicutes bacterium]|nr:alginate lyase family protein [Bacillota bacterium]